MDKCKSHIPDHFELMLDKNYRAAFEKEVIYKGGFIFKPQVSIVFENPEDYFYYSHIIEAGFHFWIKSEFREGKMFVLEDGREPTDKADAEYIEKVRKNGKSHI